MSQHQNQQHKFKLVLLGDSGVGKTALALRYAKDRFNERFESTVGAGFFLTTAWIQHPAVPIADGENQNSIFVPVQVKLEIWDTAGQERFRSITPMYIRGSKAAVVVYDISNPDSFLQAKYWVDYLRNADLAGLDNERLVIALVGNKLDLADMDQRREVEWRSGQRYAAENGLIFIEASAKTPQNVPELFHAVGQVLLKRAMEEESKGRSTAQRNGADRVRGIVLDRLETARDGARQKVRGCCN